MIVLDANCAVAIANNNPKYADILMSLLLKGEEAIAPELFKYEIASSYSKEMRFAKLGFSDIQVLVRRALSLVSSYIDIEDIIVEATSESARLNHSVYDIFYFVLARRNGATLFTLDKKLQKLCLENGVNCITEVDY